MIRVHESRDRRDRELKPRCPQQDAGDAPNPRSAGVGAAESREARVEPLRKILAYLPNGTGDQIFVVEQPLGRLLDGTLGIGERRACPHEPVRNVVKVGERSNGARRIVRQRVTVSQRARLGVECTVRRLDRRNHGTACAGGRALAVGLAASCERRFMTRRGRSRRTSSGAAT